MIINNSIFFPKPLIKTSQFYHTMKIGIISDTHDNIPNLESAIKILKENNMEVLIHSGDLCAPFMINKLDEIGVPVHVVFGNVDDRARTSLFAKESKNVTHHGDVAEIELDNQKFAVVHFPDIAFALACTKKYDVVIHGHTHNKREEKVDDTLIINSGNVMGITKEPSCAIYDTDSKKIEFFSI